MTFKAEGGLKDDVVIFALLSIPGWDCYDKAFAWVTLMSCPLHDERNLRINLIASSDVRVTWVMWLHDEHKLIKLSSYDTTKESITKVKLLLMAP